MFATAKKPEATIMPVGSAVARKPVAAPSAGSAKRRAIIQKWQKRPPFSGRLVIAGAPVQVKGGAFVLDGNRYAVSKDGRAVMDVDSLLLVGEVVGGVVRKPSAAFIKEMEILGGVV